MFAQFYPHDELTATGSQLASELNRNSSLLLQDIRLLEIFSERLKCLILHCKEVSKHMPENETKATHNETQEIPRESNRQVTKYQIPNWFPEGKRSISTEAKFYYKKCNIGMQMYLNKFAEFLKDSGLNQSSSCPHYFDCTLRMLHKFGLSKCLNKILDLEFETDLPNVRAGLKKFRSFQLLNPLPK